MASVSFATHEVLNQSPPFVDVNLFALDSPLADAVAANGGASAKQELMEFGQHWGSAAMAERGRLANENTPKLRTFDSKGNRRDEVEFHPAYHELMARSAHAGLHNSTWTGDGRPAGAPSEVVRAAKFYMASQVETGHLCPITMTRASVAALAVQPDLLARTMPVIGTRAYEMVENLVQERGEQNNTLMIVPTLIALVGILVAIAGPSLFNLMQFI